MANNLEETHPQTDASENRYKNNHNIDSDAFYVLHDNENVYENKEIRNIDSNDEYNNEEESEEYNYEEELEETEGLNEEPASNSAFLLLINILINPIEGWKKLRREAKTPESIQSECFYPLLAVLAICKFAVLFYYPRTSLSEVLVEAVSAFVSYFFGYYCILLILKQITQRKIGEQLLDNFGKNFILISLSSLCLFNIFTELLPMLWPILIFLPIWTIYIIFKGIKFFKLPENGIIKYTFIIGLTIIAIPLLLDMILDWIIPY